MRVGEDPEQAAIRIPSTTFEEGTLADHFANYILTRRRCGRAPMEPAR
jgi:hypothetical protein